MVLDLDETLVHFQTQEGLTKTDLEKLKIRPGVHEFFQVLNPYFRFVVFTAARREYAEFVIKQIDPSCKYIEKRFYRGDCKIMGKNLVKDLKLVT